MATVANEHDHQELDERTQSPFLRRVRIQSYKSIAFCDVQLRPLTILVGRNGSGKSNFLDALAFLRDILDTNLREAVERRRGWDAMVCRSTATNCIRLEVEVGFACGRPQDRIDLASLAHETPSVETPLPLFSGMDFVGTHQLEISATRHGVPFIRREKLQVRNLTNGEQAFVDVEHGELADFVPAPNSGGGLRLGGAADVMHVRPFPSEVQENATESKYPMPRSDQSFLSILGTQPYVAVGERFRSMRFYNFALEELRKSQPYQPGSLLKKDGSNLASVLQTTQALEPEMMQTLTDYLSLIAPDIARVTSLPIGYERQLRFQVHSASETPLEFTAAAMSDGTLRALGALVAAFQNVLPHGHPSVIGIEEPETSLHPAAAHALVSALDAATEHTQVLLTTHSGDWLAERDLHPSQVLVVQKHQGQTRIAPVDAASLEIIRKELYSLADLQRMDQLDLNEADLNRQITVAKAERGGMTMPLQVGVIVEGHGEYEAIRTLLQRTWYELLHGDFIEVMRPFRQKQGTLLKEEGLKAAVDAVQIKLGPTDADGLRKLVLIVIDAEDQCPKELAPQLFKWGKEVRSDADIACVLPCPMFETWLVAAATSLAGVGGLPADLTTPADPEGNRLGKGWIKKKFPHRYKGPIQQPRFAARIDLAMCRQHSSSFDKFCRELEKRLPPPPPENSPAVEG